MLNEALLAEDSATLVLGRLFGGEVRVVRRTPDGRLADRAAAGPLELLPGDDAILRRVRLVCAGRALSEAELIYVPGRLPAAMAARLSDTDLPFGTIVSSLGLRRTNLVARLCAHDEPCALEHRAVLRDARNPVAMVHERYAWSMFEGC